MPVLINPKHERFAQLIAGGANKTEAAKSLGYSPSRAASTGCNLAKDRNIAARIAELSLRASEQAICSVAVDRAWVLGRLRSVVERCMQSEPIIDDNCNVGVFTFNPAGATRALELLGKQLGLFTDRTDHIVQCVEPSKMTEEQLAMWLAFFERTAATAQPPAPDTPQGIAAGGPVVDVTSETASQ
jgi:hypothetical protein